MAILRHIPLLILAALVSACAMNKDVVATFPSEGINTVVVRASQINSAVVNERKGSVIRILGTPSGGARGYHPADPDWKETPPEDWGMQFVGEVFGPTLVISSKNEIGYMHHYYTLDNIKLEIPPGVQVKQERRVLSGSGTPDLREP